MIPAVPRRATLGLFLPFVAGKQWKPLESCHDTQLPADFCSSCPVFPAPVFRPSVPARSLCPRPWPGIRPPSFRACPFPLSSSLARRPSFRACPVPGLAPVFPAPVFPASVLRPSVPAIVLSGYCEAASDLSVRQHVCAGQISCYCRFFGICQHVHGLLS